ncbi:hypothetical protein LSH36_273g03098 [Paralvinella palmiformis]|uniref:Myeloid-derived growth factor n=1 Tax=Paralvinella palmiformis TaxID=53620 RepID=A0AAD9JK94_9ANNE|nr:hypothetical protein LSH36_273g03098 [Paralvinella palmiformis]
MVKRHLGVFICSNKMHLFVFIIILAVFSVKCKKNEVVHSVFDVKPGGTEHQFEHKAFGITCKFTYVCQGGTNEEWTHDMEKDGKIVSCSIERPGGSSYLFFQQFKVEVIGGKLVEGKAIGNGRDLNPDEYITENNSIHHVEGKFGSQLSAILLKVEKQKKKKEL